MKCSICNSASIIDIMARSRYDEYHKPVRLRCGHWNALLKAEGDQMKLDLTFSKAFETKEALIEYLSNWHGLGYMPKI